MKTFTKAKEPKRGEAMRRSPDVEVREINEDARTATVVISTEAVDSYNTILKQAGWDFTRFRKNPVLMLFHDYRNFPIGRVTDLRIMGEQTEATIQFATAEQNPEAERAWQLWKAGFLRGVSVGFTPIEWHYEEREGGSVLIFDKMQLNELSVVPIPANADTLAKELATSIRSTKKERRAGAEEALGMMIKALAMEPENDETEDETDEDVSQEDDARAILKAYRKLVPSLRKTFDVDKCDDELEQIAALRTALEQRNADDEDEQADEGTETPPDESEESKGDEGQPDENAEEETPTEDAQGDEPDDEAEEPELTDEEIEAEAEKVADAILNEHKNA